MALCEVQFKRPSPNGGDWRIFNTVFPVGKSVKVRPDVADYILTKYNAKKEGTVELVSGKRGKWVKPTPPDSRDWDRPIRLAQVDPDELRAIDPVPEELLKSFLSSTKSAVETITTGKGDDHLYPLLLLARLTGAPEEVTAALSARLAARSQE